MCRVSGARGVAALAGLLSARAARDPKYRRRGGWWRMHRWCLRLPRASLLTFSRAHFWYSPHKISLVCFLMFISSLIICLLLEHLVHGVAMLEWGIMYAWIGYFPNQPYQPYEASSMACEKMTNSLLLVLNLPAKSPRLHQLDSICASDETRANYMHR